MSSIFRITDPIPSDHSIDKYEDIEYEPVAGTNLNSSGGDIRLTIETQDIFTLPSESFLIIEGELKKHDNNRYGDNDAISLTNNGMMHLLKRIRYDLSGQEIESLVHPGQATTMLGLLKYPDDFSKSKGLNQLWCKDTTDTAVLADNKGFKTIHDYIITNSRPRGSFSLRIPLKHIFGFCGDYDKVVYGLKHNLTLTRNDDNDAIFKSNVVDGGGNPVIVNGKVVLSKISWFMPHVTPADKDKMELYKIIERKEKIPVGYRMIQCDSASIPQNSTSFSWRLSVKSSPEVPRFIIVGFQSGKSGDQMQNPSIFDNVSVTNIYVMLNSIRYPTTDYNIVFVGQKFSRVYGDAVEFRSKFFNMDELVSNPNITPEDYRQLYPLFLIDVSKQSEKLKYSTTDIQIKMHFSQGIAANTQTYAVIISDRLINFQSDGNKFSVVFLKNNFFYLSFFLVYKNEC